MLGDSVERGFEIQSAEVAQELTVTVAFLGRPGAPEKHRRRHPLPGPPPE